MIGNQYASWRNASHNTQSPNRTYISRIADFYLLFNSKRFHKLTQKIDKAHAYQYYIKNKKCSSLYTLDAFYEKNQLHNKRSTSQIKVETTLFFL